MSRHLKALASLLLFLGGSFFLFGCTAGPSQVAQTLAGSSIPGARQNLITLTMTINPNGTIDRTGRGYYIFLINSFGDPIEVTNLDTFTDMIRFDGFNFQWFHRQENVPAPGFTLANIANINDNGRISSDGTQLSVTFNVADAANPFNQFILGNRFTVQACTSDSLNGAVRGRIFDTMGTGPNIDNNSAFTVTADKIVGPVSPIPAGFPQDAINDVIIQDGLPQDFPFVNFDLARFEVTAQHQ